MVDAEMFPLTLTGAGVTRRGKRLLDSVDLTIQRGGITTIIGPNGAGKSTLLRVMHGVERLNEGAAAWAVEASTAQARQAYVFQQPVMLRRTVAENLAYPLRLIGTAKRDRINAVTTWAARIGMGEMLDAPANRLSGGERQKLALARALIRDPEVIFLDEPCANLDGAATRDIEALLQAEHRAGKTILLVTHDLGQVRRLATDIVFMLHGRVLEKGSASDVISAPQTSECAAFLKGEIVT